ncbi:hypothetical protein BCF55_1873 [Hydrogenivirga caldilitoris]|uniref:Uncharacterized protein n=1 Tax=Hydrogenivirga caldilitoris TaxID=246264 RepID=A0A497XU70_9AQUI|nr:hypothetical protein [Hydrogenivirga caldilitoris]RLJ71569.1 hypothetical protein BCF55_1873 [Hydrogenivirga caldilitoris]
MRLKNKALGLLLTSVGVVFLISYLLKFEPLNDRAQIYLDKGIKTTLASYLIVRGINAGVSVVKGSEVLLSPAGVGLSLALGEVLDPLDDITERVSALLLLSFISLGMQKLLLELLSGLLLLLAGILALLSGILVMVMGLKTSLLIRLLILTLVLRFLFPAIVFANDLVYEEFLKPRIEVVNFQLSNIKGEISSMASSIRSTQDLKNTMATIKTSVDVAFDHLLALALYFAFQTVILPVINLWLTLKLSLGALRLRV